MQARTVHLKWNGLYYHNIKVEPTFSRLEQNSKKNNQRKKNAMQTKTTSSMRSGTVWDNETEIHFGNEAYISVPISFCENMPNISIGELSMKSDCNQYEFEMEWIVK